MKPWENKCEDYGGKEGVKGWSMWLNKHQEWKSRPFFPLPRILVHIILLVHIIRESCGHMVKNKFKSFVLLFVTLHVSLNIIGTHHKI